MIRYVTMAAVACALLAGMLIASQSTAQLPAQNQTRVEAPAANPGILVANKRCSTSSDCTGSKCSNGECGHCSTSSDCAYGTCSSGNCGACSTSSDCKGWGSCSSGKCGACSTSSDCGSFGSCSSGRCEKSPY